MAFGSRKAAAGIDLGQFGDFVERDVLNLRTRLAQDAQARLEGVGHRRVQVIEHPGACDGQPCPPQGQTHRPHASLRQHFMQGDGVAH